MSYLDLRATQAFRDLGPADELSGLDQIDLQTVVAKLKPFGQIRIHDFVIHFASAVREPGLLRPDPSGGFNGLVDAEVSRVFIGT